MSLPNLITDRTQADVNLALRAAKGEIAADVPLKGAYNYTDLNRVGTAVNIVAQELANIGIDALNIEAKTSWAESDLLHESEMANYLSNIRSVTHAIPLRASAPDLPNTMQNLTFYDANNIEKRLIETDFLVSNTANANNYYFASELNSGGDF